VEGKSSPVSFLVARLIFISPSLGARWKHRALHTCTGVIALEDLYGKQGIDTPYEREKIEYRPELKPQKNRHDMRIDPKIIQKIERSRDFTIARTLMDYDQLIQEIEALMAIIEKRNQTEAFASYLQHLQAGSYKDIIDDEEAFSGIRGSGDMEIYTILYRMKKSCELRRSFVDEHFRTQITDRTDSKEITEAEYQSIDNWIDLEQQFIMLSDQLKSSFGHEDDSEEYSAAVAAIEKALLATEINKRHMESFHTTLADTAYVHRNRTVMFAGILNTIRMLVQAPQVVMPSGMKEFVLRLSTLSDLGSAKAHLMLSFADIKQTHQASKAQFVMIDDQMEQFVNRQQWFHQKVKTESTHSITTWLYNQTEGSPAFDSFASILVDSIQKNQEKYDSSVIDMLKFYQQESFFYEKQIMMIQKKEQIRQFFRIIEDLQDANAITAEWVDEYVSDHGYDA
jgi:hypothetical protein